MSHSSASGPYPPADALVRRQIRAEQLRMLFGHTAAATLLATGFAVLLAMYASRHVEAQLAHTWLALKIVTALPRVVQEQLFLGRKAQPNARWHRWALGLILLDGICWGLAGLMLLPAHDEQTIVVIGASLMGVASVATFTLHANWQANAAYCLPMIAPMAIHLLWRGDAFGMYIGAAMLVFIASLLIVARRAQRTVLEMLWHRFLIDRIVADKDAALDDAERQNLIKSQFVATMSHELRTPLHGILGLTRMLLDSVPDLGHRKQLGLVQRSGEHLLTIINHILDFSRIEAGHLNIDHRPFDLDALLEDVISLTGVSAENKGLILYDHIQLPKPCWVSGDAAKVRQVLLNLVGNAIKFTEKGRIEVRAQRRNTDGHIVIQVIDSGIGISADDQERIFDPYRQADAAVGNAVGGTGLGLTISREISRAMGGDITCSSRMGHGSTFEFSVPLPTVETPADATVPAWALSRPMLPDDELPRRLQGHVLLAEDNDVNALIVETQLRRMGLTVEQVRDGQEALERLTAPDGRRPDLVLMDCQMPRMDGFEATRRLRQHERDQQLPRLPVVALTASAMAEDSERCLSAGMDAHLPKPFHDAQLTNVLTRHLRAGRAAFSA
ncbi:MAG: ATP-binding protein [Aquabacterium sp.]|uniref:ATP-binding protein n=1 Tax=Aquabacterium sp. TaxID=1872578 RepID=UPI003BB01B7D